ncbi:alpha/beta fold hydrolase [Microbacterium sp. NIBRBAC000506063]|uniref:alpha/beta fold hydrolase n=1 Tax=Microbacterium sp. NIBRBAC000506063 TaxID=2734618 RepID=UPI001BB7018E|nr:alpha/beta hydrolase [Microbacterium sp. NIBRBAC000506063]QTV79650.1 alpha/beta hydrolase [Microbacterium sp. NIBRBAC000506063]
MTALIPAGTQATTVDTPTGPLRVLHAGHGGDRVPAVLVHGGGSDNSAISWFRALDPLGRDREVWAIDLPGFGGSIDVPPVGGPRELATVVVEAMDALGIDQAVVFGVSMGGDVALNVALDHPARVAGLVLIAPGGLIPLLRNRTTQYSAWLAAQMPDWLLLPLARFANRFVDRVLRSMVKDPSTLPAEVVPEFSREARHPKGGLAYGRYNQATIGSRGMLNDLSDRVREISVPTLLFHGEDDPLVDPEGSRRAAEETPGARLVMVPDCGHWAQLEAHDLFLREATALLAQVDERQRGA